MLVSNGGREWELRGGKVAGGDVSCERRCGWSSFRGLTTRERLAKVRAARDVVLGLAWKSSPPSEEDPLRAAGGRGLVWPPAQATIHPYQSWMLDWPQACND